MAADNSSIQDKPVVTHIRKDEEGNELTRNQVATALSLSEKRIKSLLDEVGKQKFCVDCGKPLVPILVFACENKPCGSQYILEYDEELGKIVILPVGKETIQQQK